MSRECPLATNEIISRLMILNRVIKEAQRDKDDRWRILVPQQRSLNEELSRRSKESGSEPAPTIVKMKPATLKAERLSTGPQYRVVVPLDRKKSK